MIIILINIFPHQNLERCWEPIYLCVNNIIIFVIIIIIIIHVNINLILFILIILLFITCHHYYYHHHTRGGQRFASTILLVSFVDIGGCTSLGLTLLVCVALQVAIVESHRCPAPVLWPSVMSPGPGRCRTPHGDSGHSPAVRTQVPH